jgi:hypothetical protein
MKRLFSVKALYVFLLFVFVFVAVSSNSFVIVHAQEKLTDVFRGSSFRGSASVLSKAGWLSVAMTWIISMFSILGLCLTIYQRLITLLYLSNRPLFDRVHEIKQTSMKGTGVAGFMGMFQDMKQGNSFQGLDVFIGFAYSLLPDILVNSDYNPEKKSNKFSDEDDAGQYILKTAIPTILIIFFFSIGYSGTLMKAYAVVVDAFATAADYAVDQNLSHQVDKLLKNGESYQFTLGSNGSSDGKLAQSVATTLYSEVLKRYNVVSPGLKLKVGSMCENIIFQELLGGKTPGTQEARDALAMAVATGDSKLAPDGVKLLPDTGSTSEVQSGLYSTDVESLKVDTYVNSSRSDGITKVNIKLIDCVPGGPEISGTGSTTETGEEGDPVATVELNDSLLGELFFHVQITKPAVSGATNRWFDGTNSSSDVNS